MLLGCFYQLSYEAQCQKQSREWSSFPRGKVWETWVTCAVYNLPVVLIVFYKGNHNSIFFTQTKVIGPWKQIGVWQRIINVIYGLSTCIFFPSQRYTSCSGHEEVCQLLLKQGGDVNAPTRSGKVSSPHRAAYSGHMSVINLLIKYGADPRLCDSDGPFHKVIMKLLWFEMNVGQSGSI